MKVLAGILSGIIILCYVIGAIAFFTTIWGAVGFFGSILTLPLSTSAYIIISTFTSVIGFITNAMFLTIAFVLLNYAVSEE
jgi:hypothetical protein